MQTPRASLRDTLRARLPGRSGDGSRRRPQPRSTPLSERLTLVDSRGGSPHVTRLGDGAWLVRRRGRRGAGLTLDELDPSTWVLRRRGAGRRVLRPIGRESVRAHLLIERGAHRRNALGHQLPLLRYLAEDHVGGLLRRLGVDVVLDVGANEGQYGSALRAEGYTGRIVSFEPVPHLADALERTAAGDPDWQVHRCALGDVDETLDIHVGAGRGVLSSLLPASDFGRRWSDRIDGGRTVPVPVRRLDGLLDEVLAGLEEPRVYLKLDTQGYDLRAFAGAGERVRDLVGMQSEVSMVPLYDGMPHFTEQLTAYEEKGFQLTGMFPVVRDNRTLRVIEFDAVMVRTAAVGG